jgi:hypothetical protein
MCFPFLNYNPRLDCLPSHSDLGSPQDHFEVKVHFLMTGIRNAMGNFIDHAHVQRFIVFALVLNVATLGMDTSPEIIAN